MSDNNLYFGIGKRCITPEVQVSLAGYFNARMFDKVLDDIFVQVLLLRQDGRTAGIIYFELLTVTWHIQEYLYKEISKKWPLGRENLIICASHTHTAPDSRNSSSEYSEEYTMDLFKKTLAAVQNAFDSMAPGELYVGTTTESRFAFNRRYWMKDGSVLTNPGKLNPEIDCPEGEVDHSIPMLGIKQNGQFKVLLVNISNHGDSTGGTGVSGDWMGVCRRQIETAMGNGAMCFPLISPSGNINHVDVNDPEDQVSTVEAERLGKGYAETIIKATAELKPVEKCTLKAANISVETEPRKVTEEEKAEAIAIIKQYSGIETAPGGGDLTSEDLVKRTPIALRFFAEAILSIAEDTALRTFNLVYLDFGPVGILSLPSEVFVETGAAIRNCQPEKMLLLATHSGTGSEHLKGGYIPNVWNYGRGGYETAHRSNPYEERTAEKLLDAAGKLLHNISV